LEQNQKHTHFAAASRLCQRFIVFPKKLLHNLLFSKTILYFCFSQKAFMLLTLENDERPAFENIRETAQWSANQVCAVFVRND